MPKPKTMKAGSPDEFQTDPRGLDCLMPYIRTTEGSNTVIWEPACGHGNLVRGLWERNCENVIGTDIKDWGPQVKLELDFLKKDLPTKYDIIITNPPFSKKEEFMGRCYQLGKPFALLMPITTFDSVERRKLMATHGVEIVFPEGRINFETPNHEKNVAAGKRTNSWFYTAWFTWGFNIGRQLTFTDPKSLDI